MLARRQLEVGAFQYGVDFFGAARERLRQRALHAPEVERIIDAKIEHCRRREAMNATFARRLPLVLDECLNGGYRRFSYGWKSVAQDLFLR